MILGSGGARGEGGLWDGSVVRGDGVGYQIGYSCHVAVIVKALSERGLRISPHSRAKLVQL